jgi:DNA-3-methyladenine glycosylase I
MDFDPVAVSKINEKKFVAPGSSANSLLSEQKLRAVLENARQIIKVRNGCSVII